MLAAAAGTSATSIPYGGRAELQHARDVARQFIAAARAAVEGAVVLDPPGQPASMAEVVDAIVAAVPDSAGAVGFDDVVGVGIARAGRHDARSSRCSANCRRSPLREGVAETIESFRGLLARGLVQPEPSGGRG